MAYAPKPNQGSIFKNEKKTTETHPDYTGKLLVGDTPYYINGWINTTKDGKKFLGLSIKPIDESSQAPARRQDDVRADDLPF